MTFDEVMADLAGRAIAEAAQAFETQHAQNTYAPLTKQAEVTTDGGNYFRVEVHFQPCRGAEHLPSRN